MSVPDPNAHRQFYRLALEYYVSARGALLCDVVSVTGNLLHHAVEMLLKGQLSRTIPLDELKDKKYGHALPKLWTSFTALFPTEDLSEFDPVIAGLDRFEFIRYPDRVLQQGAQIGLSYGRGRPFVNRSTPPQPPEYQVALGDIDALFKRLFPLCRMNPKAYFSFLNSHGREILTKWNDESAGWLPD